MEKFIENNHKNSEEKINQKVKAVAPMTVILALSQVLNANPNIKTNINQKADDIFANTQTTIEQNDIINNIQTTNIDANLENLIDRDPDALEKANKKINKANKKLDIENLWLNTNEIDSLITANIDKLKDLEILILSGNDLSQWLPENVFKLSNLKKLIIQEANLPEKITIPNKELKLEEFTVSYNKNLKQIIWLENILDNLKIFNRETTKVNKSRLTDDINKNKELSKTINNKIRNKSMKYR